MSFILIDVHSYRIFSLHHQFKNWSYIKLSKIELIAQTCHKMGFNSLSCHLWGYWIFLKWIHFFFQASIFLFVIFSIIFWPIYSPSFFEWMLLFKKKYLTPRGNILVGERLKNIFGEKMFKKKKEEDTSKKKWE